MHMSKRDAIPEFYDLKEELRQINHSALGLRQIDAL